ncbi:unnamed protein product [Caretta caretta]
MRPKLAGAQFLPGVGRQEKKHLVCSGMAELLLRVGFSQLLLLSAVGHGSESYRGKPEETPDYGRDEGE